MAMENREGKESGASLPRRGFVCGGLVVIFVISVGQVVLKCCASAPWKWTKQNPVSRRDLVLYRPRELELTESKFKTGIEQRKSINSSSASNLGLQYVGQLQRQLRLGTSPVSSGSNTEEVASHVPLLETGQAVGPTRVASDARELPPAEIVHSTRTRIPFPSSSPLNGNELTIASSTPEAIAGVTDVTTASADEIANAGVGDSVSARATLEFDELPMADVPAPEPTLDLRNAAVVPTPDGDDLFVQDIPSSSLGMSTPAVIMSPHTLGSGIVEVVGTPVADDVEIQELPHIVDTPPPTPSPSGSSPLGPVFLDPNSFPSPSRSILPISSMPLGLILVDSTLFPSPTESTRASAQPGPILVDSIWFPSPTISARPSITTGPILVDPSLFPSPTASVRLLIPDGPALVDPNLSPPAQSAPGPKIPTLPSVAPTKISSARPMATLTGAVPVAVALPSTSLSVSGVVQSRTVSPVVSISASSGASQSHTHPPLVSKFGVASASFVPSRPPGTSISTGTSITPTTSLSSSVPASVSPLALTSFTKPPSPIASAAGSLGPSKSPSTSVTPSPGSSKSPSVSASSLPRPSKPVGASASQGSSKLPSVSPSALLESSKLRSVSSTASLGPSKPPSVPFVSPSSYLSTSITVTATDSVRTSRTPSVISSKSHTSAVSSFFTTLSSPSNTPTPSVGSPKSSSDSALASATATATGSLSTTPSSSVGSSKSPSSYASRSTTASSLLSSHPTPSSSSSKSPNDIASESRLPTTLANVSTGTSRTPIASSSPPASVSVSLLPPGLSKSPSASSSVLAKLPSSSPSVSSSPVSMAIPSIGASRTPSVSAALSIGALASPSSTASSSFVLSQSPTSSSALSPSISALASPSVSRLVSLTALPTMSTPRSSLPSSTPSQGLLKSLMPSATASPPRVISTPVLSAASSESSLPVNSSSSSPSVALPQSPGLSITSTASIGPSRPTSASPFSTIFASIPVPNTLETSKPTSTNSRSLSLSASPFPGSARSSTAVLSNSPSPSGPATAPPTNSLPAAGTLRASMNSAPGPPTPTAGISALSIPRATPSESTSTFPSSSKRAYLTPTPTASPTQTQSSVADRCANRYQTQLHNLTSTTNFARVSMAIRLSGSKLSDTCGLTTPMVSAFVNHSSTNTQIHSSLWFVTGVQNGGPVYERNNSTELVTAAKQVVPVAYSFNSRASRIRFSETNASASVPVVSVQPSLVPSTNLSASPSLESAPSPGGLLKKYNGSVIMNIIVFADTTSLALVTGSYVNFIQSQSIVKLLNQENIWDLEWSGFARIPTRIDQSVLTPPPVTSSVPTTITAGGVSSFVVLGSMAAGLGGFIALEAALTSTAIAASSLSGI